VLRSAQMDFRILGSLEVWDGDRQLDLGGSKRRAVLALLVLHANEVVGTDRLIDQLWGDRAPRNAAAALHTHLSRLRKELGADVVVTRAWGYVLRTEPEAIDLERFQRLVADAENLPARERAERLGEALALWRGAPLEDLAVESALTGEIARLENLRLVVLENRIDADLEAGNQGAVVGELESLIAQNPLRERLRGQLILALYRGGRQAEALEVYRETRRVLADELGLEPSPELRELERAILRHDPALTATATAAVAAPDPNGEPRPGRKRRFYGGAIVAVALIGGFAVAAALVGAGSRHARRSAATVTQTTTTEQTARADRPTVTRKNGRTAGRHPAPRKKRAGPKPSASEKLATTSPRENSTSLSSVANAPTKAVASKRKQKSVARRQTKPIRIADDFSGPTIDPLIWGTWSEGTGASFAEQNGRLEFSIAGDATFESQFHTVGINVGTKCKFPGNFDTRADYSLLQWPAGNGASVSLVAYQAGPVDEISRTTTSQWGDMVNVWPGQGSAPLSDQSGSLRIARTGNVVKAYVWHHGQWKKLNSQVLPGEIWVGLTLSSNAGSWQNTSVLAAFQHFSVAAPDATCPPGSDPRDP
jgi:DNA-binding SARP family transcriptional activator